MSYKSGIKQNNTKPNLRLLAEAYLKNYIQNSALKTGDLLPPESVLSEKLGISRTAVREALKGLESLGITRAHQGKGHILQDFSYERIVEVFSYRIRPSLLNFKNLLEVRMCLEPSFLRSSMNSFNKKDIDELEKMLVVMENEPTDDEDKLIDNHMIFHHRLFKYSYNTLLLELVSMFSTIQHNFTVLYGYSTTDKSRFFQSHKDIVEALKLGHQDIVQSTYVNHFSEIYNWVQKQLAQETSA